MPTGTNKKFQLGKIAEKFGVQAVGDLNRTVGGAAPFETATSEDITLAESVTFLNRIHETRAAAVIVPLDFTCDSVPLLLAENPRVVFARVLGLFYPPGIYPETIHPSASIGKNFSCGRQVHIGAGVAIGDNVSLGDGVTLHPGVILGDDVSLGNAVEIHPNVSILRGCVIGNRVLVQAGTVIGSDGFGFAPDGKRYEKIPHTGIVQIDDDVEIGANNCIDRSTFGRTWIKSGVKTDNLVQIAHNVTIGNNTVIAAGCGIAGSTTIGAQVVIAGHAGISGHLDIGDQVTIGPKAGVMQSVDPREIVSGMPAMPHKLWLKVQNLVRKLPTFRKQIRDLEKRTAALEKKGDHRDSSHSNH